MKSCPLGGRWVEWLDLNGTEMKKYPRIVIFLSPNRYQLFHLFTDFLFICANSFNISLTIFYFFNRLISSLDQSYHF